MNKVKFFIKCHLDQMIYIGGSTVIVCLVLKFMEVPGSDYIFSFSLLLEAFIFLLGVFRPSEMPNIDENKNNNLNYNNFYQNNNKNNNENNQYGDFISGLKNLIEVVNKLKNDLQNFNLNKSYNENKNYSYNNFPVNTNINAKILNDNLDKIYNNLYLLVYYLQVQDGSLVPNCNLYPSCNNCNDASSQNGINSSSFSNSSTCYENHGYNIPSSQYSEYMMNNMANNNQIVKIIDNCISNLHACLDDLYNVFHVPLNISERGTNVCSVNNESNIVQTNKKRRGRPKKKYSNDIEKNIIEK